MAPLVVFLMGLVSSRMLVGASRELETSEECPSSEEGPRSAAGLRHVQLHRKQEPQEPDTPCEEIQWNGEADPIDMSQYEKWIDQVKQWRYYNDTLEEICGSKTVWDPDLTVISCAPGKSKVVTWTTGKGVRLWALEIPRSAYSKPSNGCRIPGYSSCEPAGTRWCPKTTCVGPSLATAPFQTSPGWKVTLPMDPWRASGSHEYIVLAEACKDNTCGEVLGTQLLGAIRTFDQEAFELTYEYHEGADGNWVDHTGWWRLRVRYGLHTMEPYLWSSPGEPDELRGEVWLSTPKVCTATTTTTTEADLPTTTEETQETEATMVEVDGRGVVSPETGKFCSGDWLKDLSEDEAREACLKACLDESFPWDKKTCNEPCGSVSFKASGKYCAMYRTFEPQIWTKCTSEAGACKNKIGMDLKDWQTWYKATMVKVDGPGVVSPETGRFCSGAWLKHLSEDEARKTCLKACLKESSPWDKTKCHFEPCASVSFKASGKYCAMYRTFEPPVWTACTSEAGACKNKIGMDLKDWHTWYKAPIMTTTTTTVIMAKARERGAPRTDAGTFMSGAYLAEYGSATEAETACKQACLDGSFPWKEGSDKPCGSVAFLASTKYCAMYWTFKPEIWTKCKKVAVACRAVGQDLSGWQTWSKKTMCNGQKAECGCPDGMVTEGVSGTETCVSGK